jgi:hypothetical protein
MRPTSSIILRIVGDDRLLALVAISDVQQCRLDPKLIARATDDVAEGDDQIRRGLAKEAIDCHRSAWEQLF